MALNAVIGDMYGYDNEKKKDLNTFGIFFDNGN